MIFSNPSEASIVVKLEAATPAGNERPAILPPQALLAAVVVGPEPPPDPTVITPFMPWV
jgi:hypothetical protein